MVSSLDDEYSVTRVAAKVDWYIPCVRCSRGGASGRIFGGRTGWVVVCGCVMGLYMCVFVKCV